MPDVGLSGALGIVILAAVALLLLLRQPVRELRRRRRERAQERKRALRRQRALDKAQRRSERAMNPVRAAARRGEPTWQQVAQRQGRKCWLCGARVQPDDAVRLQDGTLRLGASYPCVDHVVPLDQGGTHLRENVRLAHRECKQRRFASPRRGGFAPPRRTYGP